MYKKKGAEKKKKEEEMGVWSLPLAPDSEPLKVLESLVIGGSGFLLSYSLVFGNISWNFLGDERTFCSNGITPGGPLDN